MRRIQPFYYIIFLALLFILYGIVLFGIRYFSGTQSSTLTVDPPGQEQAEVLYDLWFSAAKIYDLSIDHNLNGILFSSDKNTITLLDRERKLRWEKIFATAPLQAKLSACGNYVLAGTEGGRLFFTSADQQQWWDDEGSPVEMVAISPNATYIIASRFYADEDLYRLELFSKEGKLLWNIETGRLKNLYFSSEYLDQANIYLTAFENELPVIYAVNLDGEPIWSRQSQTLLAVSRHGSRLAAVEGRRLIVYDSLGYRLWNTTLPIEIERVIFNPQNYNRILVYGSGEGAQDNLFYFDLAEDLLWTKRIADGSLFSFTADGQHIVTSSWRHYKEDYTQMLLLDRNGVEINSFELAMRVERLQVSGHPHLAVVCGEDGYIDIVDLKDLMVVTENGEVDPVFSLYTPVITALATEETRITLYFADQNSNLVPVSRVVEPGGNIYQVAADELIRGPARGSALYRTIPDKEAGIDADYNPSNGSLALDLSPEIIQLNGIVQSATVLNSLILTFSEFPEVREIILTINGEQIDSFGDGLDLDQPLVALRRDKPIYFPVISGNRFYLAVRDEADHSTGEIELRWLLEQLIRVYRSLPFVPADIALINLSISPEQVQVNFNDAFREIFPEGTGASEMQLTNLVLDSIFLTIFKNSSAQRVEILVEGSKWEPPEGYPSLSRFFRQSYYLNPEQ